MDGKLFEQRVIALAALAAAGLEPMTSFESVDTLYEVHGLEVCNIRQQADVERIRTVMKASFPQWKFSRSFTSTNQGLMFQIARDLSKEDMANLPRIAPIPSPAEAEETRKSEIKRAARMISAGIVRLLETPGDKPYPTCVRMMIEVADIWSECGDHANVENWLKKAEVLAKVFMPFPRCEILNIWHDLHAHYTRVGDYAKAVECAIQAAEFTSVNFGVVHKFHIEKRKTLAKSLFNAGRTDEAIAVSLETEQLERA